MKLLKKVRKKNLDLAEKIICNPYNLFKAKFEKEQNSGIFTRLINNIVDIFAENKTIFYEQLKLIDNNVQMRIDDEINKEKDDIIHKQKEILKLNKNHQTYINKLIKQYDTKDKVKSYTHTELNKQICINKSYNITEEETQKVVLSNIKRELIEIFETNKKIWFLNKDKNIDIDNRMIYNIDFEMPAEKDFTLYWSIKEKLLTNIGFLTGIDPNINKNIQFVEINILNQQRIWSTMKFYNKLYYDVIISLLSNLQFFDKQEICTDPEDLKFDTNKKYLELKFPEGWIVNSHMINTVMSEFYKLLFVFATKENVCIC